MAVPKLYLNGTEINYTLKDSYGYELNVENGKRQWTANIYAGENFLKPAQYGQLIGMLTGGAHPFVDEQGVSRQVEVTRVEVAGLLNGQQVIRVTLTEPGFEDDDIPIAGEFHGVAFEAMLSDFSESQDFHGQVATSISGRTLRSGHFDPRTTWTLRLPYEPGYDGLRLYSRYDCWFSYTKDGQAVRKPAANAVNGELVSMARNGDTVTLAIRFYL